MEKRNETGSLAVLFALAALARWALGWTVAGPYIFTDELQTIAMAREFPGARGLTWGGIPAYYPCWLYPLLVAPFFKWLAWDAAYACVRALNAALMASAVFPAYGLAREVGGKRQALAAAALTALLPGAGYSPTVMTENLFLPVFVLGLWMIYRAAAQPTAARRLLTGLACGLAFHVKPHGLLLPVIAAATIMIYEIRSQAPADSIPNPAFRIQKIRSYGWRVGRQWLTAAGWAIAMLPRVFEVVFLERPAEGLSLTSLAGVYAATARGALPMSPGMMAASFGAYIAAWAWCAGLLPAWTLFGSSAFRRYMKPGEPARLLAILAAVSSFAMVALAARHTVLNNDPWKLHERYFFAALPAVFALFAARSQPVGGGWVAAWWRALIVVACAVGIALVIRISAWEIPNSAPSLTGAMMLRARGAGSAALAAWLVPLAAGLLLFIIRPGGPARQKLIVALLLSGMNAGWYGFHARLLSRWSAPALEVAREVDPLVPPGEPLAVLEDGLDPGLAWRVAARNPGLTVSFKTKGRNWYARELKLDPRGQPLSPFANGKGWLLASKKLKFPQSPLKTFKDCALYRFDEPANTPKGLNSKAQGGAVLTLGQQAEIKEP